MEIGTGVLGGLIAIVIVIGLGYVISNASKNKNGNKNPTTSTNPPANNNINNNTNNQNNGGVTTPNIDRPNKSDGGSSSNNSNTNKKERVCVIELDPVTLEPLTEDKCAKPSSNPNPEGDGRGTDAPTIYDPSRPNGGNKNSKGVIIGGNKNGDGGMDKDDYDALLKNLRPRFPEPDDYYKKQEFTFTQLSSGSKQEMKNLMNLVKLSYKQAKQKSTLFDLFPYFFIKNMNEKVFC